MIGYGFELGEAVLTDAYKGRSMIDGTGTKWAVATVRSDLERRGFKNDVPNSQGLYYGLTCLLQALRMARVVPALAQKFEPRINELCLTVGMTIEILESGKIIDDGAPRAKSQWRFCAVS